MRVQHPSGLCQAVVDKVVARRGHLHAYESLEPDQTALVVIDLMVASMELDPSCKALVAPVNAMAGALREAGGTVAWVTVAPSPGVSRNLAAKVGAERARLFFEMARADDFRAALWHELDVQPTDIQVQKSGASAFFPGKCALPDLLRAKAVDTVLIAGTVTNVCCESSARDAVELGYRVTMVSDALAGHAHGLHEASLTTFYRIFGDVRPSEEILALVESSRARQATASALMRAPAERSR